MNPRIEIDRTPPTSTRLFYAELPMCDCKPNLNGPTLPQILVLVGPTAVGKTDLSIALARRYDAEIINADSRLFYRGMDIGTAKPTASQLAAVPHHLVDILDPSDPVSLATVQDMAFDAIDDVAIRGKLPILIGGTPQYVNAIVENWKIPRVEPNQEIRDRLLAEEDESPGILIAMLRDVDPAAADKHQGNTRRIIRALEVFEVTGQSITEQQGKGEPRYEALELEIWRPRESLHRRIDERVHANIEDGLVDEVRGLLEAGVDPESGSFSSIGYRQMVPYLKGESSLDEVVARIQFDCHRLVRHQETWWRKNSRLIRIDMEQPDSTAIMHAHVDEFLSSRRR